MVDLEERECVLTNLLEVCNLWEITVGKNYVGKSPFISQRIDTA
jgi:hypothetical protein